MIADVRAVRLCAMQNELPYPLHLLDVSCSVARILKDYGWLTTLGSATRSQLRQALVPHQLTCTIPLSAPDIAQSLQRRQAAEHCNVGRRLIEGAALEAEVPQLLGSCQDSRQAARERVAREGEATKAAKVRTWGQRMLPIVYFKAEVTSHAPQSGGDGAPLEDIQAEFRKGCQLGPVLLLLRPCRDAEEAQGLQRAHHRGSYIGADL